MKAFLHTRKRAVLGFGLYYVLYAAASIGGTRAGYFLYAILGSGLLLLAELLVSVEGSNINHMAGSRDYQRQPYAAQDLPQADVKTASGRFSIPFTLLLVAPPSLFFLVLFFLSFFLP